MYGMVRRDTAKVGPELRSCQEKCKLITIQGISIHKFLLHSCAIHMVDIACGAIKSNINKGCAQK